METSDCSIEKLDPSDWPRMAECFLEYMCGKGSPLYYMAKIDRVRDWKMLFNVLKTSVEKSSLVLIAVDNKTKKVVGSLIGTIVDVQNPEELVRCPEKLFPGSLPEGFESPVHPEWRSATADLLSKLLKSTDLEKYKVDKALSVSTLYLRKGYRRNDYATELAIRMVSEGSRLGVRLYITNTSSRNGYRAAARFGYDVAGEIKYKGNYKLYDLMPDEYKKEETTLRVMVVPSPYISKL